MLKNEANSDTGAEIMAEGVKTTKAVKKAVAKKAPAKKATAKKKTAKKTAVKKTVAKAAPAQKPAKKVAAKKTVAKKAVKAKAVATTVEAKPKAARKKAAPKKAAAVKSPLYLAKETYKALIAGLMDQGLDHADAVETLKVGLREANGIPVPPVLRHSAAMADAAAAAAANDALIVEAA